MSCLQDIFKVNIDFSGVSDKASFNFNVAMGVKLISRYAHDKIIKIYQRLRIFKSHSFQNICHILASIGNRFHMFINFTPFDDKFYIGVVRE